MDEYEFYASCILIISLISLTVEVWAIRGMQKKLRERVNIVGRVLICQILAMFLDAPPHLYKRSCPSVRRSVGPSVPRYFRRWTVRILGASCAVYPALLDATTHLDKRSFPSVHPSNCPSVHPLLFLKDNYGCLWEWRVFGWYHKPRYNKWRWRCRIWCTPLVLVPSSENIPPRNKSNFFGRQPEELSTIFSVSEE